jgi:hypothetical protein
MPCLLRGLNMALVNHGVRSHSDERFDCEFLQDFYSFELCCLDKRKSFL